MWDISRPPKRKGDNFLDALETRAREGVTLVTSLSLCQRERLKMAFGLEPGRLCSMGGSWTSLRSQGSYNTHSMGKEKAHRPEGITKPSVAGTRPTLQEWIHPWV